MIQKATATSRGWHFKYVKISNCINDDYGSNPCSYLYVNITITLVSMTYSCLVMIVRLIMWYAGIISCLPPSKRFVLKSFNCGKSFCIVSYSQVASFHLTCPSIWLLSFGYLDFITSLHVLSEWCSGLSWSFLLHQVLAFLFVFEYFFQWCVYDKKTWNVRWILDDVDSYN